MSDNTTNQTAPVLPARKVAVAGIAVNTPAPAATVTITTTPTAGAGGSVTVAVPTSEVSAIASDIKTEATTIATKAEALATNVVADIKTGVTDVEQEVSKVATDVSTGTTTVINDIKADVGVAEEGVKPTLGKIETMVDNAVIAVENFVASDIVAPIKKEFSQTPAIVTSAETKATGVIANVKAEVSKLETEIVTAVKNDYTNTVVDVGKVAEGIKEGYNEFIDAMTTQPIPEETLIASGVLRVVFTKTKWSIPSMLVRWALPRSRFAWALTSHCLIDTGDFLYEALPIHGVRKTPRAVALEGLTIVDTVDFQVPDVAAGVAFLESQLGKAYDYRGVLGLGIAPSRDWSSADKWFCYELAATALKSAGLDLFSSLFHITEVPLLALKANPAIAVTNS